VTADGGDDGSFDRLFLGSDAGEAAYRDAVSRARKAVVEATRTREPFSGAAPEAVEAALPAETLPESGARLADVIDEVSANVLADTVNVSHPLTAAHLHCPPSVVGLAAEVLLSATNQSLDSYDQSGAATVVEGRVIDALCGLFDFPGTADGVVTSGGTESNFQGLLLARDRYCAETLDRDVQTAGLPPAAEDLRVLCSADAHFTTEQAAHYLGLGSDAVVPVETAVDHSMDTAALDGALADLESSGRRPFAIVATAGTTDVGAIDDLEAAAALAREHDCWFHVDAAFGGALALTDERDRLDGVERADSIAVDFHKLLFQPIGCGALLLGDRAEFEYVSRHDEYLNPGDSALPNLVSKSTRTTRRFDALKPYVAFRALGREGLGALVEATLDTAERAAGLLADASDFELLAQPSLNTVLFRYRPHEALLGEELDQFTVALREGLFRDGRAVVARTRVDGRDSLKLTLMNPRTTPRDVATILDAIRDVAADVEADAPPRNG